MTFKLRVGFPSRLFSPSLWEDASLLHGAEPQHSRLSRDLPSSPSRRFQSRKWGRACTTFKVVKPCKGNKGDSSPSRSVRLPAIIPQHMPSSELGVISVAEWFESMREGTVRAPSDLLLECYLLNPPRFPKHEKYETRRRWA